MAALPSSVVRHPGWSWPFVRTAEGLRRCPVPLMAEGPSVTSIHVDLLPKDRIAVHGTPAGLTEAYKG
jgi:hypothetical protein